MILTVINQFKRTKLNYKELEIKKAAVKYEVYMNEIKQRIDSCLKIINAPTGSSITGFVQTDVDLVYLQIRKTLELIMFGSTVMHKSIGLNLKKGIEKEWNASKLFTVIEKKNPYFFPIPVKFGPSRVPNTDFEHLNVNQSEKPYLTKEEFKTLYNKVCGKFAHANSKGNYGKNPIGLIDEARIYIRKIINLLDHHTVELNNDKLLVAKTSLEKNNFFQVLVADMIEPVDDE